MTLSIPKDLDCPEWVGETNNRILNFLDCHKQFTALGPAYSSMSFKDAESNLQLYRMHKNFERPDDSHALERKTRSLWAMVDYDANGITEFQVPVNAKLDPWVRHQLYAIRKSLHEIITDYRFSVSGLEFPSGETYVSADGDVSIYAKLRDVEQLTCTESNFDLWARVAYNSPMVKSAMHRHFLDYEIKHSKKFDNARMWKIACSITLNDKNGARKRDKPNTAKAAFMVFKAKLRCITTFVAGARLSTVPKSVEVDRVITCEPFCNMVVQRAIESAVRKLILKYFDIDLDESQVLHKMLISSLENVTIDLKNASNSVFLAVIRWFFSGTTLLSHLEAARSPCVEVENGMSWQLNMLSPMGNGYTFGIMTLLLLTIVREYDSFGFVFGDDIIVHSDVAADVINLLSNIGFQTNESKTFTSGNFRESCGGFTCSGKYITSFELKWAKDEVDAVVQINKIGILAYATNSRLRSGLQQLHKDLIDIVPASLLRPVLYRKNFAASKILSELEELRGNLIHSTRYDEIRVKPFRTKRTQNIFKKFGYHLSGDKPTFNDRFSLGDGVYVREAVLQIKQTATSKKRTSWFLSSKVAKDLQLGGEPMHSYLKLVKKAKTYTNKSDKPLAPVNNINRLFGWYYIWAGRILSPNLKETYVSQRWVTEAPKVLG